MMHTAAGESAHSNANTVTIEGFCGRRVEAQRRRPGNAAARHDRKVHLVLAFARVFPDEASGSKPCRRKARRELEDALHELLRADHERDVELRALDLGSHLARLHVNKSQAALAVTRYQFVFPITTTGLIFPTLPPAGYAYDAKLARPHTMMLNAPPLVAVWRPFVLLPIGLRRYRSTFVIW